MVPALPLCEVSQVNVSRDFFSNQFDGLTLRESGRSGSLAVLVPSQAAWDLAIMPEQKRNFSF